MGYVGAFVIGCALVAILTAGVDQYQATTGDTALNVTEAPKRLMAEVHRDSLRLNANKGTVSYGNDLFSGYAVKYYSNGYMAEKTAYQEGKRAGLTERWYPDGTLSFKGIYIQNRRHGSVKHWWKDGTLRSASNYINGVPHGVLRQWYQSGALFKELNLEQGKEAGLQRAWRENGKLYANYEAKDGRIFGLKRANLCFDLDGETINFSN